MGSEASHLSPNRKLVRHRHGQVEKGAVIEKESTESKVAFELVDDDENDSFNLIEQ